MIPLNLLNYAFTIGGIAAATLIPAYIALYFICNLKFVPLKYIAALGFGLTFWFFIDTINDAALLDVNSSVASLSDFGGWTHVGLIFVSILGLTALALFDHYALQGAIRSSYSNSKFLFLIPVAIAAVMGIHSLGEGWDFGGTAVSVTTNSVSFSSLAGAFGGVLSLISYPLHKFLEASIVATVYSCYVFRAKTSSKDARWQILVLGLLFGGPSIIGSSLGYFIAFDTTYFYAFGATAALYAALRLVGPMSSSFDPLSKASMYFDWKLFAAIGFGFFLLYSAALLH